jgi:uncharacterized repeat protein (TIGR04052 family)
MPSHQRSLPAAFASALSLSLLACGDADPAPLPDASIDAAPALDAGADAGVVDEAVTIRFAARVGTATAACGATFGGLGTDGAQSVTFNDFRFYVHEIELLRADGSAVPLALDEESPWQGEGVALLDFEDGSGACTSGTAETRDRVRGRAPAGPYAGLRFVLGVPFALNHRDASSAPAPLNLSSLFWGWQGGYKFARIDATSGGNSFLVHLGSTACNGSPVGGVTRCEFENRPTITLDGFDPATDIVVADYAALVDAANLATNSPGSAPGCMSTPSDPDCRTIFTSFGLPFGTSPAAQDFFSVGRP